MNAKYLRLAILHSINGDKLTKCEYVMIVVEIITTRLILLAKIMRAWTVTIADLLRRQRELDKRMMGGE